MALLTGLLRRTADLFRAPAFDFVLIHREAAPIGPPVFEWILAHVLRRKIIYDFDDAIWIPNTSAENRLAASLKWHDKVASICRWSYRISAGNAYLCRYASTYNSNVVLNPTTIDTELLHNRLLYPEQAHELPVIGWTGTHSTLVYLEPLLPALRELEKTHTFRFVVICNHAPAWHLNSLEFRRWSKDTEIPDLMQLDIGVMPLVQDMWAEGKCGFKALQYMALGIPSVLSPVGVNKEIVEHGRNGFLCSTTEEWLTCLRMLLDNAPLRQQLGKAGQETVRTRYSVRSNEATFSGLFRK